MPKYERKNYPWCLHSRKCSASPPTPICSDAVFAPVNRFTLRDLMLFISWATILSEIVYHICRELIHGVGMRLYGIYGGDLRFQERCGPSETCLSSYIRDLLSQSCTQQLDSFPPRWSHILTRPPMSVLEFRRSRAVNLAGSQSPSRMGPAITT